MMVTLVCSDMCVAFVCATYVCNTLCTVQCNCYGSRQIGPWTVGSNCPGPISWAQQSGAHQSRPQLSGAQFAQNHLHYNCYSVRLYL